MKNSFVTLFSLTLVGCAGAGGTDVGVSEARRGYTFTRIVSRGDVAPGGGAFDSLGGDPGEWFDFEPQALNARGDAFFGAEISTGGEGLFVARNGAIRVVARAGADGIPAGANFWTSGMNRSGDVAFTFSTNPANWAPLGIAQAVYRLRVGDAAPTPLVVPDVTPVPGGGTFRGAFIRTTINDPGEVVFTGIVTTTRGVSGDLGMGIFVADRSGRITAIAAPGDRATGDGRFDFAENAWINDVGDVAFGAHVAGEECVPLGDPQPPQSERIGCGESVYLRERASGRIVSIAHQGDAAPGGGRFRLAFGARINNRGDVLFAGDLTAAPGVCQTLGAFVWSRGTVRAIARPGDALPGGGHLVTTSCFAPDYGINANGDVAFTATVDDDDNAATAPVTGLYVWSHGEMRRIARTGVALAGIGTPGWLGGASIDDQGRVLTWVGPESDAQSPNALVVATP